MTDLPCEVENRDTGWEEEEETKESERKYTAWEWQPHTGILTFILANHHNFIGFKQEKKTQVFISNYCFHSPGSKTLLHFEMHF